eukprot:gene9597-11757_t
MIAQIAIAPLVALIAGIIILIAPRLLNYVVALYLIIIGLSAAGRKARPVKSAQLPFLSIERLFSDYLRIALPRAFRYCQ